MNPNAEVQRWKNYNESKLQWIQMQKIKLLSCGALFNALLKFWNIVKQSVVGDSPFQNLNNMQQTIPANPYAIFPSILSLSNERHTWMGKEQHSHEVM